METNASDVRKLKRTCNFVFELSYWYLQTKAHNVFDVFVHVIKIYFYMSFLSEQMIVSQFMYPFTVVSNCMAVNNAR